MSGGSSWDRCVGTISGSQARSWGRSARLSPQAEAKNEAARAAQLLSSPFPSAGRRWRCQHWGRGRG
eukprot:4920937-Pyramimonas_sp.AAC.1